MHMFIGLAIIALVITAVFMYYRQKEKFENGVVIGKFAQPIPDNPLQSYTQQPLNLSFVFADPIPDTATSFDRVLSRFTDKTAPTALLQGANFPEAAPYADSEVEEVAKKALARVKGPDAPVLNFVSVEYAAKGVDNLKNAHYDIAFLVYDQVKAFSVKLALVAVVAPNGRMWLKKFASFNGLSTPKDQSGIKGVMNIEHTDLAPFSNDFISFDKMYSQEY
ncbi:hypothetical protein ATCVMO0605SPH_845R [Acanthocystis turfacea Chlorella virus MO0605SPH]|nr:hypothetical protein ATCVMO0605SPH_845R [Acanthocystis turfacea Chlorella virus MO0605SPH]AGE60233.1 hypothetical protein ATCVWI0606_861R [Acanthocystis turfacea Chlorella virus WI0606]